MHKVQVHAWKPSHLSKSRSRKTGDAKSDKAAEQWPPVYTCDYCCTYVSSKTEQLRMHKIKLHPTKKDVPFTPKRNKFVAECNNNQTQSYVTTRSRSRCSKTTSRVQNIRNYQTSVVRRSECVDRKRFASDRMTTTKNKLNDTDTYTILSLAAIIHMLIPMLNPSLTSVRTLSLTRSQCIGDRHPSRIKS